MVHFIMCMSAPLYVCMCVSDNDICCMAMHVCNDSFDTSVVWCGVVCEPTGSIEG